MTVGASHYLKDIVIMLKENYTIIQVPTTKIRQRNHLGGLRLN